MAEREKKQRRKRERREQETALAQARRQGKYRCLQILSHLVFLSGGVCFLAMLFAQLHPLLLCALWLWSIGAWCNWALEPQGRSAFVMGSKAGWHYVKRYRNLSVSLAFSAAAFLLTLILF